MKRFLLLLLVVALIVAGLAWITGPIGQASAPPPGPGDAALLNPLSPPVEQAPARQALAGSGYLILHFV
jgi:hypothetical protein